MTDQQLDRWIQTQTDNVSLCALYMEYRVAKEDLEVLKQQCAY